MGIHIGFIAANATRAELRQAFSEIWPTFAVVASEEAFRDADAVRQWREVQETVGAAGRRRGEVLVFRQHGCWATMENPSYAFAEDEEGVRKLSATLRTRVVSFVVETAGGSAFFWCFDDGKLRRKIFENDAPVETGGEPLAEEAGLPADRFYMNEVEALWNALGLTPSEWLASSADCEAIHVVARTTSTGGAAAAACADRRAATRPWWKFW